MRIVQVINHFGLDRGGAERLARDMHIDLLEAGADAHIIALEACPTGGLPNSLSLGLGTPRDPRGLPALAGALRDRARPDAIVHAHLFPTTLAVSALRRARAISGPCTMTEHNTWNRRRTHAAGRLLDRAIYAGFDRIAAISDQTRDALLAVQPQVGPRTVTVTNGARLRFDAPPARVPNAVPVILSLARLTPAKNHEGALRALSRLADRPWRYDIAGDGPERARLEALARDLGLSDRVRFLGHVTEVEPLLREADIFLLPSHWEGFGLAAVEAMNAALPCVVADVPGVREVVAGTGNPVVPPADAQAIAAALAELLAAPDRRAALGQAGFSRAATFDKRRMVSEYLAIWQTMLSEGERKTA